jgi:pyruvate,orthophosphate dikinase
MEDRMTVPNSGSTPSPGATTGKRPLARGLNASPGTATGKIVFHTDEARAAAAKGERVILVRVETSPEDVEGIRASAGILTTRGGLTGDAAIVARILGKPCVAGCSGVHVDYTERKLRVLVEDQHRSTREEVILAAGDLLTVDGSTGFVYAG